jgi:hypothetical protein
MGKVGVDFGFCHLRRMTQVVEITEALDPMAVALLSSSAVMVGAQGFAEAVQEFRLLSRRMRNSRVSAGQIGKNWCGVSLWHRLSSSFGGKMRLSYIL